MKKFLMIIAALFFLAGLANTASAASYADVAFVVDQSGSMAGEFSWINNSLNTVASEMANAGITANFGVAGYETTVGSDYSVNAWQDLTSDISAVTGEVSSVSTYGGTEYAYSAIQWGADNFSWSADNNYAKVMILITDEDPDDKSWFSYSGLTGEAAAAKLVSDENIMLNVITLSSFYSYYDDGVAYTTTDGFTGLWDLNYLRNNAADFTNDFVAGKIREIQDVNPSVPEPSSMLFLGSCLIGLAALRKKIIR